MESVIGKLTRAILEEAHQERIDTLEELLEDSIETVVDISDFFELPTENLLRIIQKSKTKDIKIIKKLVSNFSEHKGEEAPLILNAVDTEDASLAEYIEVLSRIRTCPICKRIGDIIDRDKILPKRDYEGENKYLREKISKLEEEITKLKKYNVFPKVINKPVDFEENICDAAKNGKLTSVIYHIETLHTNVETEDINESLHSASSGGHIGVVKYLVEHCHADVESISKYGETPLNNASDKGHIEVVKYLVENCHADVESKSKYGGTPLNNASWNGHIEIVKYLVENCHADVETKDEDGKTPLNNAAYNGHIEVVKYLTEHCHAEVETKDKYEYTPLHYASLRGHIEVNKYLIEKGAKISQNDIGYGRTHGNSEIKQYLGEHIN